MRAVFKGKIYNIAIFKNFLENHDAQHAKNAFENRFSILLRFTEKYIILGIQFSFNSRLRNNNAFYSISLKDDKNTLLSLVVTCLYIATDIPVFRFENFQFYS